MAPTLVKEPALDNSKSPIENTLELQDLSIIAPDMFTNARQLWHPPGARGIYGGAVIAQTLAAAQRTVPHDFVVHSYHCFFVLAGDSAIPVTYHVERVRDGRSFMTRTVQAQQRGKAIFTVTMSFTRERAASGKKIVQHAASMPPGVTEIPPDDYEEPFESPVTSPFRPFMSIRLSVPEIPRDAPPATRKTRQWVRARGKISETGGHQAHLNAFAYISDSLFIGTVGRVHRIMRTPAKSLKDLERFSPEQQEQLKRDFDPSGIVLEEDFREDRDRVGMMVSLDHTIYFHNPKKIRADEWMLTEMETPWAGDERGLVTQRVYSKDGTLLASCFQEGVIRLREPSKAPKEEAKL